MIRDPSGRLIEYKLDQEGQVVETSLRESVLRAAADAAGGTMVPASLSDQAGAIREIVAAVKRSPSTESRAADLRPMGWLPLLVGALLLLGQTLVRRGSSLVVLALAVALPSAGAAQRPSAGERALPRATRRAPRAPSCRRRARDSGVTPPSTTRGRPPSVPAT